MMECAFCARGETQCRYGERCVQSERSRALRQSRLDPDYESGSDRGSGGRDGAEGAASGAATCTTAPGLAVTETSTATIEAGCGEAEGEIEKESRMR